ncbi:hypothetical protein [Dactylosporangium sp. CA-139066]|uniref:hypothetical protein n=1 Tax=Dactylosporangium sp. CA-139066 TaxID=3239930 RepID=UPI003D922605
MRTRRALLGVVAVVAAALAGGCDSSSQTTGDACTDVRNTMTHYTTDAPEYKAMTDEVQKSYKGTGDPGKLEAAKATYYKAFGNALRPIADEAKAPELKTAIAKVADAYSAGNGDVSALQDVVKLCPQQP